MEGGLVLISKEGTVHRQSAALFRRSKLISSILEASAGEASAGEAVAAAEPIPLIVITDAQLAQVVEYLTKNAAEPVLRIYTPLVRGPLHESGLPLWAEEFIMALSEGEVMQLLDTARFLQIKM